MPLVDMFMYVWLYQGIRQWCNQWYCKIIDPALPSLAPSSTAQQLVRSLATVRSVRSGGWLTHACKLQRVAARGVNRGPSQVSRHKRLARLLSPSRSTIGGSSAAHQPRWCRASRHSSFFLDFSQLPLACKLHMWPSVLSPPPLPRTHVAPVVGTNVGTQS